MTNHYFAHYQILICHPQTRQFVPHVGRGSIGLLSNNAPVRAAVDKHCASEHRPFVRAKARFAGQKAQEHSFVRRNAVTPGILPCIVGGIFGGKCRACLALPEVPASDLSVLIHSRWLLPGPLRHPPPPGMSLFRCFRCYLDRPPALHGPLPHPSLPGVSLFWRFRCYLDRPPALHGLLRYPSPPGVSRFR